MINLEVLVWDKMPIYMIARIPEEGKIFLCRLDKVADGICSYECEPVSSEPELYEKSLDILWGSCRSTCSLAVPETMLKDEVVPLSFLHENTGNLIHSPA